MSAFHRGLPTLKRGARSAAIFFAADQLLRLGVPALGALVFLVVLMLGVVCWVVASPERTERLSRLLLASRGDARSLSRPDRSIRRTKDRP
jgi:hypothetical protein